MKKLVSIILAAMLLVGAISVTAVAETNVTTPADMTVAEDTITQATKQAPQKQGPQINEQDAQKQGAPRQAPNGNMDIPKNNRRMTPPSPQTNQNTPNMHGRTFPANENSNINDSENAENTNSATSQSQAPQKPENNRVQFGRRMEHGNRRIVTLDTLLKENVISQETYDAIKEYLEKGKDEGSAESTHDLQGSDGEAPPVELPVIPEDGRREPDDVVTILRELLEDGTLTKDVFEQILSAIQKQ